MFQVNLPGFVDGEERWIVHLGFHQFGITLSSEVSSLHRPEECSEEPRPIQPLSQLTARLCLCRAENSWRLCLSDIL